MDNKINFKANKPENALLKNVRVVAFNIFAGFFNWFIILICLIILAAGYWWLIKPKYDFINNDTELSFRKTEYDEKVSYLKQLNDIKNLYKTSINQSDKDKIDLILSAGQDIDRLKIILLREVDKAVKERGAIIDNVVITPLDNSKEKMIKISDESKKGQSFDKLGLVQVSFDVKSINYEQLKRLLARLESSLRIMDVTDLNFDPVARSGGVKLLTYHLEQ
ncbi:MAG: hypothetical protein NTY12_00480 [Candidatus Falkowbacteria bacterium]|nr:hypothetical protein [Candidatus Falkowbacteria bacterium]